jgi:hypothetical protein
MATVYDEQALEALTAMAAADLDPAKFRDLLTEYFPSWQGSCADSGYAEEGSERTLKVSRLLHDALPRPFNQREYNWRDTHGLKEVLFFVDWPDRSAGDIAALLASAMQGCEAVIANA